MPGVLFVPAFLVLTVFVPAWSQRQTTAARRNTFGYMVGRGVSLPLRALPPPFP